MPALKRFRKFLIYPITILVVIALFGGIIAYHKTSVGKASDAVVFPKSELAALNELPEEKIKVAEDDISELYVGKQRDCAVIDVVEKATGNVWKSYETAEYYTGLASEMQLTMISQMLTLYYTDFESDSGSVMAGAIDTETTYEAENGKLKLLFCFNEYEIKVTVLIWLENGQMCASIPFDGIREEGKYGVYYIELFPCFEAAKESEDGYAFLPDGCGILCEFGSDRQNAFLQYWDIYSPLETDMDVIKDNGDNGILCASVPVYGMKKGGKAFAGIITGGEGDSKIAFAPAGHRVRMYRTYPAFYFRRRNVLVVTAGNTSKEIVRIEKNPVKTDFSVQYCLLSGEKANYSGMAAAYRDYLESHSLLNAAVKKNDWPVSVDFVMTVKEKQMFFSKTNIMTDFKTTENVLEELNRGGVTGIQTILYGWQKDGYGVNPSHNSLSSAIGGLQGLKELSKGMSKYGGKLFLADDYCYGQNRVNGFASGKQAVCDMNQLVLSNKTKDSFLVNPSLSKGMLSESIDRLEDSGISGIAFEKTGKLLYENYKRGKELSRFETSEIWKDMTASSAKAFGSAAAEGGNSYMYGNTERLFGLPGKDSEYFRLGTQVPFLQIVLHGSIYYSSEYLNLSADPTESKLRCIEYGSMPSVVLTDKDAELLKNTVLSVIFTSNTEQWSRYIKDLYRELNPVLSPLSAEKITEHIRLTNEVVQVKYQNGTSIYINYGEKEYSDGIVTVAPQDYYVD